MLSGPAKLVLPLAAAVSTAMGQMTTEVPIAMTRLELDLRINYEARSLGGTAALSIRNVGSTMVPRVQLLLNRLMTVSRVQQGDRAVEFQQDVVVFSDDPSRQVTLIDVGLARPLAAGDSVTLTTAYSGVLTGYTETGSLYIRDHVSREFTIIREDAYAFPVVGAPSLQAMRSAPRRPFDFAARIAVPSGLVVAMGGSRGMKRDADSISTWSYRSIEPVPFLNITIAPYRIVEGPGFRLFAFPEDSAGAAGVSNAIANALRTLAAWYGSLVRQPDIAVMEIPEAFGSQASLSAGIILTADAFRDRSQLRQLYHELSHLWNPTDTDVPSPRWNEGLATFLQWRLAAELDGWSDWSARLETAAQALLRRCAANCATRALAEYGRAGMTDLSYTTGFLMFAALFQTLGAEVFDRTYRQFLQTSMSAGASTTDLARAFRTADSRSENILDEWLFTTRWHARLAAGETMARIVAGYRK
jgi:hypothetical protein